MMDALHENSIHAISAIQKSFTDQKYLMFALSNIFDPRYAFLFYSPLIFSFDRITGRKLMWTTVFAEWSNQILKWLMRGERPYWWVQEYAAEQKQSLAANAAYVMNKLPPIEQTFMTCETGPGSPSGHAMVTAAVWYILVEALLKRLQQNGDEKHSMIVVGKNSLLSSVFWSIYTFVLCCVSLSRIYLAAHFPHQCLLGMGMGVAVAILVSSFADNVLSRMTRKAYILGTCGMFASAFLTYVILLSFGFNPHWSVERALKWCAKREHVHLDTTPFFSIMRYTGFFLGMGLGLHSSFYRATCSVRICKVSKVLTIIASLLISKIIEKIPIPSESLNVNVIYAIIFVQSIMLPYIFVGIVPFVVMKLLSNTSEQDKQNANANEEWNNKKIESEQSNGFNFNNGKSCGLESRRRPQSQQINGLSKNASDSNNNNLIH